MIRVLIADDSVTARELLAAMLSANPGIEVIGMAKDGREAVELTKCLRPDLVTMDLHMPVMNGFEATKQIMIEAPTPIIIVTAGLDVNDVKVSMEALRVGALALLDKPALGAGDFQAACARVTSTVKAMAGVKVVRHFAPRTPAAQPQAQAARSPRIRLVAIAASTGGPAALARVFADLPGQFPVPIIVVQHIAKGFVTGFASWLNSSCPLQVKVAQEGEALQPSRVYLAPDDVHLGVDAHLRARLNHSAPIDGFRPSATFTFQSVAKVLGPAALSLILTGMGQDGVAGLADIKKAGGRIAAQDEASSVVFGMPGAAIARGLADRALPLAGIGEWLITQVCSG
ncbi:MAG: chemotaxis-specific protein-glutamate methyltransferase CheB [Rhodospirillaceae bacterium]|nr:chemotaxis-specific protein-glutamate methyltransferase CheB [Rhodospirillaceae bacterium]